MKYFPVLLMATLFCTACDSQNLGAGEDSRNKSKEEPSKATAPALQVTPSTPSTPPKVPESPLGPVSVGGISPGKTTVSELSELLSNSIDGEYVVGDYITPEKLKTNKSNYSNGQYSAKLIKLDEKGATIYTKNGIVYKVDIFLYFDEEEVIGALYQKYGAPTIKEGVIEEVTCQNGFGASFKRPFGIEKLRWKASSGVSAYIQSMAADCKERIYKSYVVEHLPTVSLIDAENKAKIDSQLSEKIEGIKGAL